MRFVDPFFALIFAVIINTCLTFIIYKMKAPIKINGKHWREIFPKADNINALALAVARKLVLHNPVKDADNPSAVGDSLAHFISEHPDGVGFTIRMPFDLWHRVQCALGEWSMAYLSSDGKVRPPYTISYTKDGDCIARVGGFSIHILPREFALTPGKDGRTQKVPLTEGTMANGNLSWGKTSDDGFMRSTMHSKDSPLAIDGQKDFRFGTGADTELGKRLYDWAKSFRGYAENPFGDKLEPYGQRQGRSQRPERQGGYRNQKNSSNYGNTRDRSDRGSAAQRPRKRR